MPTSRRRSMHSPSPRRTTRRSSSNLTIRPATASTSPPCGALRPTRRSGSPARTPPRRATTSARAPSSSRRWEHQSEIVLEPNPNWYGDVKPTLTEIRFHIGGDPAASQAAFEAGEYDIVSAPPAEVSARQGRSRARSAAPAGAEPTSTTGASMTTKGPDRQPSLPPCAEHGDRQGGAARYRLRRRGHRRRQPHAARCARAPARHRPPVRRRGGQGGARDRAH